LFKIILNTFLLFVIVPCFCMGQSVRFQFYRIKACATVEKLDTDYSLYKIPGSLDTDYEPKNGITHLPGPGKYGISAWGPRIDTVFNIKDTGLFVFRFKEPDHGLITTGAVDQPALYSKCDNLLNGYQEYHYPNGTLEMRGVFKGGYPKDSIMFFYRNGKLRSKSLTFPKKIIYSRFDSLGNKLKTGWVEHKSFMTYRDSEDKDFYTDGALKKRDAYLKHFHFIEEYYPDGLLKIKLDKKKRVEYFANRKVHCVYYWKDKTEDRKDEWKTFVIYKRLYDENGILLEYARYQQWGHIIQPKLSISEADWIEQYEKYENGKKVFELEDVDMEEYMKQHPDTFKEEAGNDNDF